MTEHDDVSGTLVNKNIVLMISNNTMAGFNGHKIFLNTSDACVRILTY